MPRPLRADEAAGLYHALNRGNRPGHDLSQRCGLRRHSSAFSRKVCNDTMCNCFAFQLMPNHWHFVLRPNQEGEMSRFLRWVTATHTMRYHAHYHSSGAGHVYQGRFKSFPVQGDEHFLTVCRYVERNALRADLAGVPKPGVGVRYGVGFRQSEPEPRLLPPWPIPRLPRLARSESTSGSRIKNLPHIRTVCEAWKSLWRTDVARIERDAFRFGIDTASARPPPSSIPKGEHPTTSPDLFESSNVRYGIVSQGCCLWACGDSWPFLGW